MQGILGTPIHNLQGLANPIKLTLVSEELVVPSGEVNQMTQIIMTKPSDVWREITPEYGYPLELLTVLPQKINRKL